MGIQTQSWVTQSLEDTGMSPPIPTPTPSLWLPFFPTLPVPLQRPPPPPRVGS